MNDSFGSGSSGEDINLTLAQTDKDYDHQDLQVLKSPRYSQIDASNCYPAYQVEGYFTDYKQDICTPALFRCSSSDSSTLDDHFVFIQTKLLFKVCKYLSLIDAQTKMMQLNKNSRQFLQR